jgi:hypothetical protein
MSLGKLLATGRSLVGGAPDAGRYNISERNRLPKFGAAKNPFAQPPAPATPEAVTRVESAPVSAPAPVAAPSLPPDVVVRAEAPNEPMAKVKLTQRLAGWWNLARAGAVRVAAVVWPWLKAMAARLGGWLGGAMKKFKRREPKPLIPRFGKPAVQAELSLDNVKVVRSDLVESDLEVIEADTSTGTRSSPRSPVTTPKRGPVPPALKKLTDRILGPQLH